MNTTKLMRRTANALRVYRIASKENTNIEIQNYLSSTYNRLLKLMMIQQNIKFYSEAIKIIDELILNNNYE